MMPRKLKDIDVDEITLCASAANRKTFYIQKRRTDMKELLEILKSVLGEETVTDESIEKMKGLTDENVEALKKSLDAIEEYREDFTSELDEAVVALIKQSTIDYPVKESEKELDIEDFTDVKKAGQKFSKATLSQLHKIRDAIDSLLKAKEAKSKGDGDEKLSEETLTKLDRLAELENAETERLKAKEKEDMDADIKKQVKEQVEEIIEEEGLKKKPTKKSIEGQEGAGDEDEDDDREDKWKSIPMPSKDA